MPRRHVRPSSPWSIWSASRAISIGSPCLTSTAGRCMATTMRRLPAMCRLWSKLWRLTIRPSDRASGVACGANPLRYWRSGCWCAMTPLVRSCSGNHWARSWNGSSASRAPRSIWSALTAPYSRAHAPNSSNAWTSSGRSWVRSTARPEPSIPPPIPPRSCRYPASTDNRWRIWSASPTIRTAYLEQRRFELIAYTGVALLLILASLGLFYYMRHALRPLYAAVDTVSTLAEGDLNVSFDTRRQDEVGKLMRALQGMAERLRDIIGHLACGQRRSA
jgi:HAMP domain-containing protein